MKYAFNTFTLAANEAVFVTGSDSLFTYQNTGSNSGLLQGSNDAIEWTDIVTVAPSASKTATHSFKFIRLVGDTSIIANRGTVSSTPGSGSGFSYGGEWDATATEVLTTAEFNVLTDCTISGNTIVPSASQFGATSQNLSKTDVGTQMTFKVTWPDTSAGFFMVGLHTSELTNGLAASNDTTASFVGIGASGGTVLELLREGATFSQNPAGISINAGDVIIIGYRPAVSLLYISNETQNTFNILQLSLYPDFQTSQVNLAVYAQLNTSVTFEFPASYPLQQSNYSLSLPSDFTKTYLVSAAGIGSVVNGKLLKQGDFVYFFENDSVTDVLVSRLLSDSDLNSIVTNITIPLEVALKAYADNLVIGLLEDCGNYNPTLTNAYPTSANGGSGVAGEILKGDLWSISADGTIAGIVVSEGDFIRALADSPGQTASNWAIVGNSIGSSRYMFNDQTGTTYTVLSSDVTSNGRVVVTCTNASAIAVSLDTPSNYGASVGDSFNIRQGGAGALTITGTGGATLTGNATTTAQHETKTLIAKTATEWFVVGG